MPNPPTGRCLLRQRADADSANGPMPTPPTGRCRLCQCADADSANGPMLTPPMGLCQHRQRADADSANGTMPTTIPIRHRLVTEYRLNAVTGRDRNDTLSIPTGDISRYCAGTDLIPHLNVPTGRTRYRFDIEKPVSIRRELPFCPVHIFRKTSNVFYIYLFTNINIK
jgi:hypothetical protein